MTRLGSTKSARTLVQLAVMWVMCCKATYGERQISAVLPTPVGMTQRAEGDSSEEYGTCMSGLGLGAVATGGTQHHCCESIAVCTRRILDSTIPWL